MVAAQRRASGQVWVVVSGLSGPATYGSAIALASQHTGTMPAPPASGSYSRLAVLWALVETTVRLGSRAARTLFLECGERTFDTSMQGFHERPAGHETCCLPCCGMMRAHRVRQTYDHRLRDAIAATGNADLFRDVSIPASTRRTWARGEVRPVVAAVDVELQVYDWSRSINYDSERGCRRRSSDCWCDC